MSPTSEMQALAAPSRRGLLTRLLASLLVAAVIVVCFILPAEYHRDPTGVGKLTGLMALSAPPPMDKPASSSLDLIAAPNTSDIPGSADSPAGAAPAGSPGNPARFYGATFRSDEIQIPLKPDEELEYKVRLRPGGTLIYSWSTSKGMVYYDFHGEPADPKKSQSYATGVTNRLSGSLIAPFAGIHGWFLQNQEGDPIVVTLKMSGFYELRDSQQQ